MQDAIINFHFESTEFRLSDEDHFRNWLLRIAKFHLRVINEINYIFCDDEYLIGINKSYLDHDTYTDIITFPYSYDPIESDIYISIDRIKENATSFKVTWQSELQRVMAHGLLHLIGFNDKTKKEQESMRIEENKAIQLF